MTKSSSFSIHNRAQTLKELVDKSYDLVIIGGGITGAGILLDAASRGLNAILVEKNDFASGTSSKSTKLIHGGLRYLKQFDFGLVKEVGTERAIVHKLAPHLVIPEKMLLPLIENGSYSRSLASIGLKVYDILARVKGDDRRKMLNKKSTLELEPLLPEEILKGCGYYAEYRTDDARLTIENLKTALTYGGEALNYCKVEKMQYNSNDTISGVQITDELTGKEFKIKSDYVISAAGPWVDTLRTVDNSLKGKRLHLTKGVHIVLPYEKLPIKQSIYFDVPDGRMMFAIPRGKITYVGTSDTDYNGNKDGVYATTNDVEYLLSATNNIFPSINLNKNDVISSWAGLRPLIHQEGKSASELSRKDEIFISTSGFISIAGGKLTGYRKMAERVVDIVAGKKDKNQLKPCSTAKIKLLGNGFKDFNEVKKYVTIIYDKLKTLGLSKNDAKYLVYNYGKQTDAILEIYKEGTEKDNRVRMILAELKFALNHEMVVNPMDFFIRRTGRLYFDIESLQVFMEPILNEFQRVFNSSDSTINQWRETLQNEMKLHSEFA